MYYCMFSFPLFYFIFHRKQLLWLRESWAFQTYPSLHDCVSSEHFSCVLWKLCGCDSWVSVATPRPMSLREHNFPAKGVKRRREPHPRWTLNPIWKHPSLASHHPSLSCNLNRVSSTIHPSLSSSALKLSSCHRRGEFWSDVDSPGRGIVSFGHQPSSRHRHPFPPIAAPRCPSSAAYCPPGGGELSGIACAALWGR